MNSVDVDYLVMVRKHSTGKVFTSQWGDLNEFYFRIDMDEDSTEFCFDLNWNSIHSPVHDIDDYSTLSEEELFQASLLWEFNTVPFELIVQMQKFGLERLRVIADDAEPFMRTRKKITIPY